MPVRRVLSRALTNRRYELSDTRSDLITLRFVCLLQEWRLALSVMRKKKEEESRVPSPRKLLLAPSSPGRNAGAQGRAVSKDQLSPSASSSSKSLSISLRGRSPARSRKAINEQATRSSSIGATSVNRCDKCQVSFTDVA